MTTPTELVALRERVAGNALNEFDRCWLATLGTGTLVGVVGTGRGDDGGDEFAVLVDIPGGRRRVYLPERDMPDVSVDAALAFVERVLPASEPSLFKRRGEWGARVKTKDWRVFSSFEFYDEPNEADQIRRSPNGAIALILAALTALINSETGHDHE